jgi:hypothetical protein
MDVEFIDPLVPCLTYDGEHERVVIQTFSSAVPLDVLCPICGVRWNIAVFGP